MALSKITNASVADTAVHGRRNLIINSAMQVAQRGTSFTAPTNSSYTLDRFRAYQQGGGVYDVEQSTTAPAGFTNSLKATVTTTDDPVSTDYYILQHRVEGINTAHLSFGTSDAKKITLSFWVRSSVTGTYSLSFTNHDSNYSHAKSYIINSANTWEHKTLTIDGATSGTWKTSTTESGVKIAFDLGSGSNFLHAPNVWNSVNMHGATGQTDWINNSGATFYLTGVQLEVGDKATPFEHRSFAEELSLAQRYYEVMQAATGHLGGVTGSSSAGFSYDWPTKNWTQAFNTTKRAAPTVTKTISANGSNNASIYGSINGVKMFTSVVTGYEYIDKVTADAEL